MLLPVVVQVGTERRHHRAWYVYSRGTNFRGRSFAPTLCLDALPERLPQDQCVGARRGLGCQLPLRSSFLSGNVEGEAGDVGSPVVGEAGDVSTQRFGRAGSGRGGASVGHPATNRSTSSCG